MSETITRIDPSIQQFVLLDSIERRMRSIDARLEAVEARGLAFPLDRIHQWRNIPAGGNGVIYDFDLSRFYPCVAFIHYVGCNWFPNTFYLWEIDNANKERVERIIGSAVAPVSEPLRLDKPIVAHRRIRWIAYNNDVVPHVFEVLNDGILHVPEIAKYIGGQTLGSLKEIV